MTSDPGPSLTDEQYRGMYEGLYVRAGSNFAAVPWAALHPHPELARWLDAEPGGAGRAALVVGCGLGDDAEAVAAQGFSVTAFDFSPAAIHGATERFPDSAVHYRVADLLDLPRQWRATFDLVVEIRTLQSMPPDRRTAAVAAIAGTLAPGGTLFVHSFGAEDTEGGASFDGPPWPVTEHQLAGLAETGLTRVEHRSTAVSPRAWSFTSVYRRAAS